jgi:hypothetical protein
MFVDNERRLMTPHTHTPPPKKERGIKGKSGAGFHAGIKVELRVFLPVNQETRQGALPGGPTARHDQLGHTAEVFRTQGPSVPRPQMVTSQFISERFKGARGAGGAGVLRSLKQRAIDEPESTQLSFW